MTTPQVVTRRKIGYTDPHELAPSRLSHGFGLLAIAVIMVGDAAAFQQLVAVAMPDSIVQVVWALIIALSCAATVSMHLAGVSTRKREAGSAHAGRLWFASLIVGWMALGGMALWFRLTVATSQDGGAGASATGNVFGSPTSTAAATDIPLAALMLGLYVVGGITAYGIGYGMHNPARSAYLRAHGQRRRALRAVRWAYWRASRADARSLRPRRRSLLRWLVRRARFASRRASSPPSTAGLAVASMQTPDLAQRRELVRSRAHAQADQLKQLARHQLAAALSEPARTSGVFEGFALIEANSTTKDMKEDQ